MLKQRSKKDTNLSCFFKPKPKEHNPPPRPLLSQGTSISMSPTDVASVSVKVQTSPNFCKGVFYEYNDLDGFGGNIMLYGRFSAISATSGYMVGMVDSQFFQFFSRQCTGAEGKVRAITKNITHWNCDHCNNCTGFNKKKLRQTINERASHTRAAICATKRSELTHIDHEAMKRFVHTPRKAFSQAGLQLVQTVKAEIDYYEHVAKLIKQEVTSKISSSPNKFVPGKNDFLRNVKKMYKEDELKTPEKQNLLIALMKMYIAKASILLVVSPSPVA